MDAAVRDYSPDDVLDYWFPDDGFCESRDAFEAWIEHRMQGGVDDHICTHFVGLTTAAAQGLLDDWAETPRGRLALILALDQFPRSLWRDTPGAFAQDCKATRLAMEGIRNGHFKAIKAWEKLFYLISLAHCEGPDHLARFDLIDEITEEIIAELPPALEYAADSLRARNARVRGIIERFGRHPHRNPIYGRVSSPEEEVYIAAGDFPHLPSKS
ncbi:DUF924 family protein [Tropicimonas sp. IMCC6043]|uniref:DUF924 family protein n=1 Tax=Tropicimonas sp. IMCC6043 TaxID=2510645 RepID=UPI00101BCCC7|nr:DUF924 family protein [Tropicimonas sp. IMCC6043]RYH09839.1 DUF924 domain-containing protein [Tropicimonas sp. IMCC6043]